MTSLRSKIIALLKDAQQNRIFPGCVAGVITSKTSKNPVIIPIGTHTYASHSPAMDEFSVFDAASLTKSIPTACLALLLIEQGHLKLTDKIVKYIPELNCAYKSEITLFHVLTFSLDFDVPLSSLKNKTADAILQNIFSYQFKNPPGTVIRFANATSILLGLVVERAAEKSLEVLAHEYFFEPLAMTRTSFHPQKNLSLDRIVPTEIDSTRGKIQGVVHDESAYVLQQKYIPGSAGLFSCVPDLLTFVGTLLKLLNGGAFHKSQIFKQETIKYMCSPALTYANETVSLGWEMNGQFFGSSPSSHAFAKTGFTGCMLFVDIPKKVGIVMLSNATWPKRKVRDQHMTLLNSVRKQVIDAVYSHFFPRNCA